MLDKDRERKGMALRAPTLSDADWSQFASDELARYLTDPDAADRAALINAQAIDDHPLEDNVPPDVGMLLGMRSWIAGEHD